MQLIPSRKWTRSGIATHPLRVLQEAPQFTRFAGVGAIGTSAHYLCLYALVEFAAFGAVLGSSIGFLLGALINYHLNRAITFKSNVPLWSGFSKFLVIATLGALLNAGLMWTLIQGAGMYYLIAQVLATCLVLTWNFLGNKFWTFDDVGAEPRS